MIDSISSGLRRKYPGLDPLVLVLRDVWRLAVEALRAYRYMFSPSKEGIYIYKFHHSSLSLSSGFSLLLKADERCGSKGMLINHPFVHLDTLRLQSGLVFA